MTDTISYSRDIPLRHTCDVMIAGGGPAGVAAALAAAERGAEVFLAESHTCLGGMGTAGMVPAFMQFSDGVNFLAGGIGRRVLDNLREDNGTVPETGLGIRAEVLKRVYDSLLTEAGINFTFHSHAVDIRKTENNIAEVICAGKSGLYAVRAAAFVDATGDGDLAAFAGAPYEKGDEKGRMMPGTLCSLWSGIDWEAVKAGGLGTGRSQLERAFKDNVFSVEDWHVSGMWATGDTLGGANVGHTFGVDGCSEESLTKAYVYGRKLVPEFERYYKEYLKGFETMELAGTGSLLGVRETRRITCDYVLNIDDFKNLAVFDDEIGRYSYPVDIHVMEPGRKAYDKFLNEHQTMRLKNGENYGIPYRTLTPKGLDNLLVAGRCICTDRYVQSSVRVMPGCYITGQAAGTAAAMIADQKRTSREIDVKSLQENLKKLGAYLPNLK